MHVKNGFSQDDPAGGMQECISALEQDTFQIITRGYLSEDKHGTS